MNFDIAHFDPRQAVYEFLKQKDRRNREPCSEVYQEREIVKKFFKSDNGCFLIFIFLRDGLLFETLSEIF